MSNVVHEAVGVRVGTAARRYFLKDPKHTSALRLKWGTYDSNCKSAESEDWTG